MEQVLAPRSLRSVAAFDPVDEKFAGVSGKKASAVAGMIALASVSRGAQAQQSNQTKRAGGLFQDANVAGRDDVTDDRRGRFISTKFTPANDIEITKRGLRLSSGFRA
ncbi:hypothetical protein [Bradyrhizobium sp. LVM 105]|uniref:hypothetical protein n=1 Tax=Bradyrhizobium sp. LVM 105 TaxID=2341115 RepID=UPI000F802AD4|nr:hypothetical protein [Bradyrhizobium sp. LVM 105]RTE88952.1 hypothetical protein D6B98_32930 [Bradyrhizobium sp. LVM 105]